MKEKRGLFLSCFEREREIEIGGEREMEMEMEKGYVSVCVSVCASQT